MNWSSNLRASLMDSIVLGTTATEYPVTLSFLMYTLSYMQLFY